MSEQSSAGLRVSREGPVLKLVLDRPARLNALSHELTAALAEVIEKAATDDGTRVVLLTGAGRAFSSGADLAADPVGTDTTEVVQEVNPVDYGNRLVTAMRALPKPIVAAVNGPAVGAGCSIALAADLVVARESAYFLLAFAKVGLMPDSGATAFLTSSVGRMLGARMALLAERIPARTALDWGLISHVVGDDEFGQRVDEIVATLAAGPLLAYARAKQAFTVAETADLATVLAEERDGQAQCLASADFAEGVAAFTERRAPVFTGR